MPPELPQFAFSGSAHQHRHGSADPGSRHPSTAGQPVPPTVRLRRVHTSRTPQGYHNDPGAPQRQCRDPSPGVACPLPGTRLQSVPVCAGRCSTQHAVRDGQGRPASVIGEALAQEAPGGEGQHHEGSGHEGYGHAAPRQRARDG
ncbi:hypothetical protein ANAPC5_01326 [Anaplasma phagocytophilum]|nr:hypothetical protein ANAPC5_01326 [Anaplasma phagocytophilum]